MIKEYVNMEAALWVLVADAEPHGIYSNVTAQVICESQCLNVTPFSEAWLFLDVVQHPQDWIWFGKPMSCMFSCCCCSPTPPGVIFPRRGGKGSSYLSRARAGWVLSNLL